MAILVRVGRALRRSGDHRESPSVREVCLLGGAGAPGRQGENELLEWAGRRYRVAARQGGEAGYLHLTPASGA